MCVHAYMCMHIITIHKKREHEFERVRRGVWEDLEGGNRMKK